MKINYFKYWVLLLLLLSCKKSINVRAIPPYYQKDNALIFTDIADLIYSDCLEFKADSDVTSALTGVDYLNDTVNKKQYLSFLSPITQSIYIYDFQKRELINKVPLFSKGTNKTGRIINPSMHKMLNKDSIAFFNFDHLFILSNKGKKLKSIVLHSAPKKEVDYLNDIEPRACPGTFSPIIPFGNSLYVTCGYNSLVTDQNKIKDLFRVDIQNNTKVSLFNRPKLYNYGFWGYNENLYKLYSTLNLKAHKIVLSYPADPFLYSYNLNSGIVKKEGFIGSKYFAKIEPYLKVHGEIQRSQSDDIMHESAEHEICNPSYYALMYDDKNDVYIRVAFLPRTIKEYQSPITRYRFKCTFIIIDNKFRKIGEQIISNGMSVDYRLMFVQNGFLHIFNKDKYSKNSNNLYFDRYKIRIKS